MINTSDTPKITYPVTILEIIPNMPDINDTAPIPTKKEATTK